MMPVRLYTIYIALDILHTTYRLDLLRQYNALSHSSQTGTACCIPSRYLVYSIKYSTLYIEQMAHGKPSLALTCCRKHNHQLFRIRACLARKPQAHSTSSTIFGLRTISQIRHLSSPESTQSLARRVCSARALSRQVRLSLVPQPRRELGLLMLGIYFTWAYIRLKSRWECY